MGKKVSFRLYLLLSPVLLNPVVLLAGNLPGKLVVSQAEAERLFLQNNLLLIAEHYNVDKAEAEIVQARLLENPVLSLEQNIYNRLNKKYFDVGAQGEAIVSIEQVINLAGQRGKAVKVAGLNKEVVSRQFEDVVRTLAGELRQRFISVFFLQKSLGVSDREVASLEHLLTVMAGQQARGNISLMERTRLEAFLLNLRSERMQLQNDLADGLGELCLLMGVPSGTNIETELPNETLDRIASQPVMLDRLESSLNQRPDLKASESQVLRSEANLKLQRSLAAPSFSLGGTFDRQGNFIDHYFGLTASVSIPIFNRNQGNIRSARFDIRQSNTQKEFLRNQAETELQAAYIRFQNSLRLYRETPGGLEEDFDRLIAEVEKNFTNRNISVLEFVDYYESYKESALRLYDLKHAALAAADELRTVAGTAIWTD